MIRISQAFKALIFAEGYQKALILTGAVKTLHLLVITKNEKRGTDVIVHTFRNRHSNRIIDFPNQS
jgi:hypothetical protein